MIKIYDSSIIDLDEQLNFSVNIIFNEAEFIKGDNLLKYMHKVLYNMRRCIRAYQGKCDDVTVTKTDNGFKSSFNFRGTDADRRYISRYTRELNSNNKSPKTAIVIQLNYDSVVEDYLCAYDVSD